MSEITKESLLETRMLATRLAVRAAQGDLLAFIMLMNPHFDVAPHHRVICDELMRLESGAIDRILIAIPPRSSKSMIASIYFPAWCVGRNAMWLFLGISHSADLAIKFGRNVRDIVMTPQFQTIFPNVHIKKDSRAADLWALDEGGEFQSVGVNTGIAGFGAHLAMIDDPLSEQDAWSPAARARVMEWYTGGLRSRLMPTGRVGLIQCMTGDTAVSMADNTWKRLDSIIPGDLVKAYKDGELVNRRVLNWAPQGEDDILEIRTGTNRVCANARHPFLIDTDRGFSWIPAGKLTTGMKVVTCGVSKEVRIKPSVLSEKDAWLLGYMFGDGWITKRNTIQKGYKDKMYPRRGYVTCVALSSKEDENLKVVEHFENIFGIIPKQTKFGYRRTDIARIGRWFTERGLVGIAKTKRLPSYLFSEPLVVREAFLRGFFEADGHIISSGYYQGGWCFGSCNINLITDLRQLARDLGYRPSNIHAYVKWAQAPNSPIPTLSNHVTFTINRPDLRIATTFVTEKIRSIKPAKRAQVYDIQVDDAECFIADGVVSHNTRWHENDLAGALLAVSEENALADEWVQIVIPAFNTTSTARRLNQAREKLIEQGYLEADYPVLQIGESFWPKANKGIHAWPTEKLLRTKNNTPPYQWNSLYMQNPTDTEGGILPAKLWQDWKKDGPPACLSVILSVDGAYTTKESHSSSYSAITVWGVFDDQDISREKMPSGEDSKQLALILLGAERGHWAYPELKEAVLAKYRDHVADVVIIEKKASGQSLIQELAHALPLFPFNPDRDKIARAHACSSLLYSKKLYAPLRKLWAQEVITECNTFPNGPHNDYVDTLTQAVLWFRKSGLVRADLDDAAWTDEEEYDIIDKHRPRSYY